MFGTYLEGTLKAQKSQPPPWFVNFEKNLECRLPSLMVGVWLAFQLMSLTYECGSLLSGQALRRASLTTSTTRLVGLPSQVQLACASLTLLTRRSLRLHSV